MCVQCRAIETVIRTALPSSTARELDVQHEGDAIVLRGRCRSYAIKKEIQDTARRITLGKVVLQNRFEVAEWMAT